MSKSTLWKVIRRLGFKYHDSKENPEDGSWEITEDITVKNFNQQIAEEITENIVLNKPNIVVIKQVPVTENNIETVTEEKLTSQRVVSVLKPKKKRIKKKVKVEITPDDDMKEIVCEICGFVGKDDKEYNKHFSSHKYCHKCGALFEGRNASRSLKRHITQCGVIKPEKLKEKFECLKCHKKFEFKSYLTRHSLSSKCSKIENPENFAETETTSALESETELMETVEKSITEENSVLEKDLSGTTSVLENEHELMETVEKSVKEENYVEEKDLGEADNGQTNDNEQLMTE